jgi:hypothetical protein
MATNRVIALVAALAGAMLLYHLLRHAAAGDGGMQSYGVLAQAFLDGRLDVPACPEKDCAVVDGRTYVIFPPVPALVAMPFVALFGPGFAGFAALGIALAGVTLAAWHGIFTALRLDRWDRAWLLAALAFASPLYGVTLAADRVWFFAQVVGFMLASLAVWAAVRRGSLPLAALALGGAFLCRQMYVLLFPALLVLSLPPQRSWLRPVWDTLRQVLAAGLVLGGFVAAYCLYNLARFGDPFETGYRFLANAGDAVTFMDLRIRELGLFSRDYALQNLLYLFFQGFHLEFGGRYFTGMRGVDALGTSLLAASPWVVLAAFMRLDRVALVLLLTIGGVAGITLFYHSNGAYQVHMQRYTLDWLPLLLVLMARSPRPAAYAALPVLVAWGVVLNLVAVVLAARLGIVAPGV